MTGEPRPVPAARRLVVRTLQIGTGIIGGAFCFFLCERMFAGYPRYGTDILTYIGLALVMAIGGAAWLIDQRRLDSDE